MSTDVEVVAVSGEIVTGTAPPRTTAADATAAWLGKFASPDTREAYERDVRAYIWWCGEVAGVDPFRARLMDVDTYVAYLREAPSERTGKPLARSSTARRLAAISSWYRYMEAHGLVGVSPMPNVDRPYVDGESTTTGMTMDEVKEMIRVSADDRDPLGALCSYAIIVFVAFLGPRVSEVCNVTTGDLAYDGPIRTALLRMKGGKRRVRAVPPVVADALAAWLASRGIDPDTCDRDTVVFVDADGRSLTRKDLMRLVKRCAKQAGFPNAARITPHSFRHAWATASREAGATLEERQFALGHADPRTTQRYDRAKMSVARDPSLLVAAAAA